MRYLFAMVILLFIAGPSTAQRGSVRGVISGRSYPLSLRLKDLNGRWRRVTVHATASSDGNINVVVHHGDGSLSNNQNTISGLGSGAGGVYYTAGQTVTIGGSTYLVAYARPAASVLETLLQAVVAGKPPVSESLTADSPLTLSLLDLRTVGSLRDIRAFDLKRELAESQKEHAALEKAMKAVGGTGGGAPEAPGR